MRRMELKTTKSSSVQKDDSFLLHLSNPKESSQAPDDLSEIFASKKSSILDSRTEDLRSNSLLPLSPKNRGDSWGRQLLKEADDLKKELHYIEKDKQLVELMNKVKEEKYKLGNILLIYLDS